MENLTRNENTLNELMKEKGWDYHTTPFYSSECDKHGDYKRGWWTKNAQQAYGYVFLGRSISEASETIIER